MKKAKDQNKDYLYIQADGTGVYVFQYKCKLFLICDAIPKRFTMYQQQRTLIIRKEYNKEFWVLKKSYATIINI